MLTVMELITFPLFRDFRLVSGYGGLYNQVTGTGIFEWESPCDVEKNFEQGEFVVTTLSLSKSDIARAESSIRMLIDKKVSAIAVKDIYFHEISEELRSYSDQQHIPVFFFSDTFFDDIIFTIKNTLLTQHRDFNRDNQIEFLLVEAHTPELKKRKAKEINPFFHSNLICCYAAIKKGAQWQKELSALRLDPEETVYSVIDYQQGILVVFTMKNPGSDQAEPEQGIISFLEKSGLKGCMKQIGYSSTFRGLEQLGTAIQESLYSHSSCLINQGEDLWFQDTGIDQILLPMKDNVWMRKYYERMLSAIEAYDNQHGTKLLDTLLVFAESNGDIKLASQKLFQHSNTIRYRVDKVRKLLSLGDDADSFAQLILLARLHKIYQNKDSI